MYYKMGQALLQSSTAFLSYKTEKVVLQSVGGIAKLDNLYY